MAKGRKISEAAIERIGVESSQLNKFLIRQAYPGAQFPGGEVCRQCFMSWSKRHNLSRKSEHGEMLVYFLRFVFRTVFL